MFRPLLAAIILVSLAACQAQDADEPAAPGSNASVTASNETAPETRDRPIAAPTTAVSDDAPARDSDCGADKVSGRWLNALPTEDVKASIRETVGERPIRYYTQGDPITMDFSPARLNVELGKDGRIKLFRCG